MAKHRLLRGSHGRWEKGVHHIYKPGDAIELTKKQATEFGSRVEPYKALPADTPADAPAEETN